MKRDTSDFLRRKCLLVLGILALGLGVALAWSAWEAFGEGKGYPESYLLGAPAGRFGDYTDHALVANLPNPYLDPTAMYSPAAYALLRLVGRHDAFYLVLIDFLGLVALGWLLARLLRPVTSCPWARVGLAFLFMAVAYPVLYCLDRGNLEIIIAPLVAWALYFFARGEDVKGCACLLPAICLKFYPALFLLLLLRRRKTGLALLCGFGAVLIVAASLLVFPIPASEIWGCLNHNLGFYRDYYVLGNGPLESATSPWNAYKIALLGLQQLNLIAPVNFGFDGALVIASYRVYTLLLALLTLACAADAWMFERRWPRALIVLLLLLSIAAPAGGDYRLLYTFMALVLLMLLPGQRRGDWTVLVLLAIALVPKKELLLSFAGTTETGFFDVPVQAVLNPLLILAALGILLVHARPSLAWRRARHRLADLLPSRWKWM